MAVSHGAAVGGGDRRLFGRWPLLVVAGYLLALDACYLIATSRWGSYVGVPHQSIYIGDVLFAASLASWLVGGGPAALWRSRRRSPIVWIVLAIAAWTLMRLATGSLNAVALRDAAPYLYLLGVLVAMTAPLAPRKLFLMLVAAAAVHVCWLAITLQSPSWFASLPHLGPTQMFQLRDDYDETIAGIAMSAGIVVALQSELWSARIAGLALTAVSVWDIDQMTNRGGVLAVLACLPVVAIALVRTESLRLAAMRQHVMPVAFALGLCTAVGAGLFQSPAVHRLAFGANTSVDRPPPATSVSPTPTATKHPTPANTSLKNHGGPPPTSKTRPSAASTSTTGSRHRPAGSTSSAPPSPQQRLTSEEETAGTTLARKVAWRDVYHYTTRKTTRMVFGVGFGPNFMQSAGALELLSGGIPGLRAPHNILLNTWARLGLIGLVLHLALLALALVAAGRYVLSSGAGRGIGWVVLTLAFTIAAMFGVVFEAPFGALPYAFAVGLVDCLLRHRADALTAAQPAGSLLPQADVRSLGSGRPAEVSP